MGSHFWDAYWRSRIPMDLYHEVRAIMEETLDWEFLCLKTDELTNSLLRKQALKRTKKRKKKKKANVLKKRHVPNLYSCARKYGSDWRD